MKADFVRWSAAPPSWVASFDAGPAVSSRVRIARNIAGLPFPHNASPAARKHVLQEAFHALKVGEPLERTQSFMLSSLTPLERTFLMERQLMSHQHATEDGDHGLIVGPGESISIMVNEEDHLRAAVFRSGADLSSAWDTLAGVDDAMAARLPLAFDPEFGFLTACPTNVGTGLRASALMHLPALVLSGRIQPVLTQLQQAGLTARGFYGEGTSSLGDLIQISNTQTLGHPEGVTVRNVEKVVRQVTNLEAKAAAELMSAESRSAVEDRAYRALGTLRSARLLDYSECMRCLSLVRFGLRLNLPLPTSVQAINELIFLTQPAHLRLRAERGEFRGNEPALRAEFVRERLQGTGSDA
jgi:protein arginine kinase